MESACPHLGADMSHADIEECDNSAIAVCPWHRYDFDLRTGESETGLRACTYRVKVIVDKSDDVEKVWVEEPDNGTQWRLVELRPVSEEFADPPPVVVIPDLPRIQLIAIEDEPLIPTDKTPSTLMEWAVVILNTANPKLKVERTKHAVQLFRTGQLVSIGHKSKTVPKPPAVPSRDDCYTRNTVDPRKLGKRKNVAVMLHALANIEQWAIDLAWDIMVRFGPSHPDIPQEFFSDFSRMALDESKHFSLPHLSTGCHFAFNAGRFERFRRTGDTDSVEVLEIVHADEVTHVTTGHRWFTWLCERQGVDPVATFREEVRRGWRGEIKGPFNVEARETAGLSRPFYEDLRGEWDAVDREKSEQAQAAETYPSLQVEYDRS
ncbi:hypothetical protein JVU11DRAFT_7572 [Chiua virens]|nr:hypothetical protein JVU11DRAFT_7572 [Chiua virens]